MCLVLRFVCDEIHALSSSCWYNGFLSFLATITLTTLWMLMFFGIAIWEAHIQQNHHINYGFCMLSKHKAKLFCCTRVSNAIKQLGKLWFCMLSKNIRKGFFTAHASPIQQNLCKNLVCVCFQNIQKGCFAVRASPIQQNPYKSYDFVACFQHIKKGCFAARAPPIQQNHHPNYGFCMLSKYREELFCCTCASHTTKSWQKLCVSACSQNYTERVFCCTCIFPHNKILTTTNVFLYDLETTSPYGYCGWRPQKSDLNVFFAARSGLKFMRDKRLHNGGLKFMRDKR